MPFNMKQFLRESEEEWQTSAVEAKDNPGGSFSPLPDSIYIARLTAAELGLSQQNEDPQVIWTWTILEGEYRGEQTRDFDNLMRDDAFLWLARKFNKYGFDPAGMKLRNLETKLGEVAEAGVTARIKLKTVIGKTGNEFQTFRVQKLYANNYNPEGTDDDDVPAPRPAPKSRPAPVEDDDDTPAPPKKRKPAPVDDMEDPFADDDAPPPKKKTRPAPQPDEDEDEDDAPPPPKKKRPAPVEDDDDDDDTPPARPAKRKAAPVDDDEEDDEPAPPKRKAKPAPVDDDDDEDEAPPPPKKKPAPAAEPEPEPKRGRGRPPKTAANTEAAAPAPKPKAKPAPPPEDDDDDVTLAIGSRVEFTRKGKPYIGVVTELPDDENDENATCVVKVGDREFEVPVKDLASVDDETDD